jgi:hypothetical protein
MKRGILFFSACLFLWGIIADVAFAGFGITPPYVRNEALRPGSEYTQEIIIVRSDPVEDLNAEISMNLYGIDSWFSFDRGLKFTLPKGESQVRLNVTVNVPEDADLGPYNGNIRIRTSSARGPSTGVSIALGAQIDVSLKVVDEIYDFQVRRVEIYDAEEGYKKWWLDYPGKIKFAMFIENTGNVPSAPTDVILDIYDVSGREKLETTHHTNKIEKILPFANKKVIAHLPTTLSPGGYRVKYKIAKTVEGDLAQEGELALSILPFGTITGYEKYGFEGLSLGDKLSLISPPILLILLIVFLTIWGRGSRKRTKRVRREYVEDHEDDEPPSAPVRPVRRVRASGGVVDLSRRR